MSERTKRIVAGASVAAVVVVGIVVVLVGLASPVSFGWFAYQPLADATFVGGGGGVFLSATTITGCVILTCGLLAAAFFAGRYVARTRNERPDTDSSRGVAESAG